MTTTRRGPLTATPVLVAIGVPLMVRPMTAGEEGTVQAVSDGMSPSSRRMRFLTGVPRLTAPMMRLLTAVDHERHGAWVAEADGCPVAIASWVRLSDTRDAADISLAVVDSWQGRGIGRVLLELIGVAAAEAGVTAFDHPAGRAAGAGGSGPSSSAPRAIPRPVPAHRAAGGDCVVRGDAAL